MSNDFCRYISNGLTIYNTADRVAVAPCCFYKDKKSFDLNDVTGIVEYRKSLNQIDQWTPNCSICQEMESYNTGGVSLRQASFDWIPKDRKSTRLNSSHVKRSRMPSSA